MPTLTEQISEGGDVLRSSFEGVWIDFAAFVPKLFVALLIFIFGWIAGAVVGRVISNLISALKIDNALEKMHVGDAVARAGFRLNIGMFLGKVVEWFIIIVFLIASLDVLGLQAVNEFLRETVLSYLPNVIVAAFILVISAYLADAVQKLVTGSVRATNSPAAGFLGGIAKWSIWAFALLAALVQLGIAPELLSILFTGLVAMLAIAGGLAFGLGGKDAAKDYLERLRKDISGH